MVTKFAKLLEGIDQELPGILRGSSEVGSITFDLTQECSARIELPAKDCGVAMVWRLSWIGGAWVCEPLVSLADYLGRCEDARGIS